jgi:hypothetical protein
MNNRLEQFVRDHREEFDSQEPDSKVWDSIRRDMGLPDSGEKKQAKVFRLYRMRWTAAAAILVLIAGTTWYFNASHNNDKTNHLPPVASSKTVAPVTIPSTRPDTAAGVNGGTRTPDDTHSLAATNPIGSNPAGTNAGSNRNNSKPDESGNAVLDASVNEEMYHYAKLVEIKHRELRVIKGDEPLLYKQFSADVSTLDSVYHSLQMQLPRNPNREQILEAMLQNLQLQMGLLNHQLEIIKQINHSKKTAYDKAYKTT